MLTELFKLHLYTILYHDTHINTYHTISDADAMLLHLIQLRLPVEKNTLTILCYIHY